MAKNASRKKKQPSLAQRFHQGALNTLAVCLAMLPIIFVGVWLMGVTKETKPEVASAQDTRKVSTFEFMNKPTTPRLFAEPLVSVTFDDGWESAYTYAMPLLQKYNIRTTQYILSGEFDNPLYVSEAQAHAMKDAGHEIGSHTVDHKMLTTLSNADMLYELQVSKETLKKDGLISGSNVNFASPNSDTNDTVLKNVAKFYTSHRNTLGDITNGVTADDVNVGPVLPRYNIIAYAVRQNTSTADIQFALEYAKQHNGWLVLVYHQIDESEELFSVSPHTLETQLQAIKQASIKIVTVGDVMATNPRMQ